jgi:cellulose synthase (UDP-forming)
MLDADHVPTPDSLDALVGYFDDPELALVQTPHDFFNQDSAQHYEPGRHEQSVFFSVIMAGKDRHGGAFWCGSAALLRRAALLQIGGAATETLAEDFHTTLRLHKHGWRTRYHAETVVQGLAPHSLAAYLLQRDRWARGNLAVFRTPESPLRRRGLTASQRLSYLASLNAYVAGPVRALLLAVLATVLWTGAMPLATGWTQLLTLWLPATASSVIAGSALSRGFMRAKETFHFEITCAQTHLRALPSVLIGPRPTAAFKVTPKEGLDAGGWSALRQLKLPGMLAAALAVGLVARLLAGAELIRLPALPGIAITVVPAVAAVELYRLLRTLRVHQRRRQFRAAFRFPCQTAVRLNKGGPSGEPVVATLIDINTGGAGLIAPAPLAPGTPVALSLSLPDATGELHRVQSSAIITSCRTAVHNHRVGVRFVNLDAAGIQVLTEYCFVVASFRRLRAITTVPRRLATLPATTTASAG